MSHRAWASVRQQVFPELTQYFPLMVMLCPHSCILTPPCLPTLSPGLSNTTFPGLGRASLPLCSWLLPPMIRVFPGKLSRPHLISQLLSGLRSATCLPPPQYGFLLLLFTWSSLLTTPARASPCTVLVLGEDGCHSTVLCA